MPTGSLLQIRETWRWHNHYISPCTRTGEIMLHVFVVEKTKQCSYSLCSSCFLHLGSLTEFPHQQVSPTNSEEVSDMLNHFYASACTHFQATSAAKTHWRRGLSVYFLMCPNKSDSSWKTALSFQLQEVMNGCTGTCLKLIKEKKPS